ncbi:MAG: hypothetical protein M1822_009054 [Bathelium mastoideum]|nr:MAG: hypothetical protein M1822_009054 [Bathelium mastoideum]
MARPSDKDFAHPQQDDDAFRKVGARSPAQCFDQQDYNMDDADAGTEAVPKAADQMVSFSNAYQTTPRKEHSKPNEGSGRAAARFVGIFELLEQTLSYLPGQELLQAQRVSRTWHAIIQRSLPLQRKLWMEPYTDKRVDLRNSTIANGVCYSTTNEKVPITINPYLMKFGEFERVGMYGDEDEWVLTAQFSEYALALGYEAIDYPGASWRRMLITDPPCSSLEPTLVLGMIDRYDVSTPVSIPSNPNGLTLGEVVDAVLAWKDREFGTKLTSIEEAESCRTEKDLQGCDHVQSLVPKYRKLSDIPIFILLSGWEYQLA